MKKSTAYLNGIKVSLPIILGYLPVAMAFAVMATDVGMTQMETILMSVLVFAGASQIMAVGMVSGGATMISVVIATFVFNLRHFIMGSYIMRKLGKTSIGQKFALTNGITDESFAIVGATPKDKCTVHFILGIITVTYGSWIVGTIIGAFASVFIPEIVSNALGIAIYALFVALLVPGIKKDIRLIVLVIFTAILNAVLTYFIPSSWAIIASSIIGALFGVFFVKDEEVEK